MRLSSSLKTASFVFDFAVDGGAVSTIQMGAFLPVNAVVIFGVANVITALTSGGSATIAVGWTTSTAALIGATAVASWGAGAILPGVDLPGAPVLATSARQLAVTIAAAALLTGKFQYTCLYIEAAL